MGWDNILLDENSASGMLLDSLVVKHSLLVGIEVLVLLKWTSNSGISDYLFKEETVESDLKISKSEFLSYEELFLSEELGEIFSLISYILSDRGFEGILEALWLLWAKHYLQNSRLDIIGDSHDLSNLALFLGSGSHHLIMSGDTGHKLEAGLGLGDIGTVVLEVWKVWEVESLVLLVSRSPGFEALCLLGKLNIYKSGEHSDELGWSHMVPVPHNHLGSNLFKRGTFDLVVEGVHHSFAQFLGWVDERQLPEFLLVRINKGECDVHNSLGVLFVVHGTGLGGLS